MTDGDPAIFSRRIWDALAVLTFAQGPNEGVGREVIWGRAARTDRGEASARGRGGAHAGGVSASEQGCRGRGRGRRCQTFFKAFLAQVESCPQVFAASKLNDVAQARTRLLARSRRPRASARAREAPRASRPRTAPGGSRVPSRGSASTRARRRKGRGCGSGAAAGGTQPHGAGPAARPRTSPRRRTRPRLQTSRSPRSQHRARARTRTHIGPGRALGEGRRPPARAGRDRAETGAQERQVCGETALPRPRSQDLPYVAAVTKAVSPPQLRLRGRSGQRPAGRKTQ